jgi:hypothetical protein
VILECKTASPSGVLSNPRAEEAAKFRAAHSADYSILLGPAFGHDSSLDDELTTHGVSLWTVDDLVTALQEEIGPAELRETLAPGRVAHALEGVLWERERGRAKRVAVILPAGSPALTDEALAFMVDDALLRAGVVGGQRARIRSSAACVGGRRAGAESWGGLRCSYSSRGPQISRSLVIVFR